MIYEIIDNFIADIVIKEFLPEKLLKRVLSNIVLNT